MAVEVVTSALVPPSEPTPRGALWLSNLDLAARNGYTPTVYFFRRPDDGFCGGGGGDFFSADVLRAALAAALVPFYPFAGRLGAGPDGRAEVDCNAEGALFVVARSAAALDDVFEGFAPSEAMRDMFVPAYESAGPGAPLLLLQVTFFRCGGVALGTAMHHFVIDGRSAFNFIRTWAGIARGDAGAAVAPSLDRTPLRARPQPAVLFDHTHEYGGGRRTAAAAAGGSSKQEYASAILRVSGAQAAALRARAGAVSTFRALVAHVWRCACAARALAPDAESRLYTMVDMRARLCPPLPEAFFGNAVARTSASARVGDLLGGPLGFGARRLRAATGHGDEYARSLVDYLEAADPAALPRGGLPGTDLRVISWLGMPSYDADFGWGEPALLAPALMYYPGFVYLLNCPGKEGGVAVAAALEPERMERFKELFFEELATLV
ncbi:shikimate O-hydroxycinnamoyltransferase-like [Panicum miliaceum]|uniref:Shikimate O-hydroxycinnamoyltransferase-like n=1 Tax=Panicum miliaceum TaxID=4540 RepID=A0A3L6T4Q7_PANMI|nr:shikimate O-hydroxycinnamoyltransferase-like [Panicum miliaceum]